MKQPVRLSPGSQRGSGWRAGAALIFLVLILVGPPHDARAHAFLDRSDPAANQVLATAPDEVRIWFTEPLETAYTSANLFDARGNQISTPDAVVDEDDPQLLILPLPASLATGAYTVAWRNISSVDGHPAEGFFAFTIGAEADVEIPAAPAVTQFGGPPTAVQAAGRWFVLLGLMGVLGMLMTLFWVLPAGLVHLPAAFRAGLWRVLRRAMFGGLGLAFSGSVMLLVNQTLTVQPDFSPVAAFDLLSDSNFGHYWLFRGAAMVVLAVVLLLTPRTDDFSLWRRIALTAAATMPLVPVSRTSHAAAVGAGEGAATLADLAHLVAGSAWIGGLFALAAALVMMRGQPSAQRRAALVNVIPRFSTLAIASVLVLVASGMYAAWLHVGNLTALTDTDYGGVLMLKLILMLALLILGALNLLVLAPRLRAAAPGRPEFRRSVVAEALIGVAILLLVGLLTSLPTARGELETASGRVGSNLSHGGTDAALVVSPGAAGANRYTLDFERHLDLPSASQVFLRFSAVDGDIAGLSEIELQPVGDSRFEGSGSDLSVVGDWRVEALLRRPDRTDWRATTELAIGAEAPPAQAPGDAARFPGLAGALALLATLLAVPLTVVGLRMPRHRLALVAGSCILLVGVAALLLIAA